VRAVSRARQDAVLATEMPAAAKLGPVGRLPVTTLPRTVEWLAPATSMPALSGGLR
jgi:hypothetical protein